MTTKNKTYFVLIFVYFIVLAIIITWPAILLQKTFFAGDLKSIFQPTYRLLALALKNGDFPLWSNYVHSGFPIFAWSQGAFLYPPVLLFMTLADSFIAFNLLIIFHISLAGIFTWIYLKQIGLDKVSSLIGATSFCLSSFLVTRIQHPNILMSVVWLPLALYLLEKLLWEPKNPRYFIGLVFALTMPLMTGQPQYALFIYFIFSSYYLFKIWRNRVSRTKNTKRFILMLFGIFLLVAGLSAVQMLPLWELKGLSDRATGINSEGLYYGSLPPAQILRFVWPRFFGWDSPDQNFTANYWGKEGSWLELNPYLGIIPLILAFVSLFYKKRKQMVFFYWTIALIGVSLALGKYFILGRIVSKMPIISSFSVPARWIFLTVFSLSVLTAFGASKLTQITRKERNRIAYPLLIIFGLLLEFSFIYNFLTLSPKNQNSKIIDLYLTYTDTILPEQIVQTTTPEQIVTILTHSGPSILIWHNWVVLISFFIFFIGWYIYRKKIIDHNTWRILLLITLIIDLVSLNVGYSKMVAIQSIKTPPKTARFIINTNQPANSHNLFRIFTTPDNEFILTHSRSDLALGPGFSTLYGLSNIDMVGALPEKLYQQILDLLGAHDNRITSNPAQPFFIRTFRFLHFLNVKYILHGNFLDPNFLSERRVFELVFNDPEIKIYENKAVLPRFYMVPNYRLMPTNDIDTVRLLKDVSFDVDSEVMLEKEPKLHYNSFTDLTNASVKIKEYKPEKIALQVTTPANALLVISDLFYPGWKASINGKKSEILRANYVYRALEIKPGDHQIILEFKPNSFKKGLFLSLGTLFMLAYLLFINKNKTPRT